MLTKCQTLCEVKGRLMGHGDRLLIVSLLTNLNRICPHDLRHSLMRLGK